MLTVKKIVVGELLTNCYLVYSVEKECLIIDPGDEATFIENVIGDLELKPLLIILTHGHFDHCLAALELSLAYKIPVYLNKADKFLLKRTVTTASHFTGHNDALAPVKTLDIKDRVKFTLGKENLTAFKIPGHTPGGVALYSRKHAVIFSGDLIFEDGAYGEISHSYSDRKKFDISVRWILSLPGDTIIYAGHGGEFVVQSFRKC
jgi:hydroxyacylglutathione hydrolase